MKPVTENTEQYIENKSFDETFQINTTEMIGYDSDNNVLRRIGVDANGYLEIV